VPLNAEGKKIADAWDPARDTHALPLAVFIISTDFKKEPDGSKWTPTACEAR